MEGWDQETLERVVKEKHGAEEGKQANNPTNIICKHFLVSAGQAVPHTWHMCNSYMFLSQACLSFLPQPVDGHCSSRSVTCCCPMGHDGGSAQPNCIGSARSFLSQYVGISIAPAGGCGEEAVWLVLEVSQWQRLQVQVRRRALLLLHEVAEESQPTEQLMCRS
jgi:hypothetical protein